MSEFLQGRVGTWGGAQIFESPAMSWRDPPIMFAANAFSGPAIYCGDARYLVEWLEGVWYVRAAFDDLYARLGLRRETTP